ncbi:DUF2345 domain-containing protein [Psychrobacter alimentarius]|uniref:DUF2345 domain-containing protein n=1 Tax=Psychrobacter alimentarius TaxID=261164 RepID=UPI00191A8B2B|nr:DUF2345 domain-containing protein [Psychrobacter alimentarius]
MTTGLDRSVNDHNVIKTQLESIAKEQSTKTHQQTPYTLIDSAADSGYVSKDLLIQRSMGEMISTTQQDMTISSGDSHQQISSESLNLIADGQFSMTNAKDNITLSAHTGKLEATAKQDVNIASSTKEVEVVAANKITLTAGGASITLDGADITISAKQFTEKGGKHSKAGSGSDGLSLNKMPSKVLKLKDSMLSLIYGEGFQLLESATQQPLANQTVWIKRANGDIEMVQTDAEGKTPQITEDKKENIDLLTPPQLGIFIG